MRYSWAIYVFIIALSGVFFLSPQIGYATSTGPNNPGTSVGVGVTGACTNSVNWANTGSPGNASANDTNYITITGTSWDLNEVSDELRLSNFGFSAVSGTVTGILVETLGWTPAGTANYTTVQLFSAPGTNVGTNKATGALPASDPGTTYTSWGSSSDAWNSGLTASQINNANFGIALCFTATADNSNISLDHVRVTVTYDVAPTLSISKPDAGGSTVTVGDSYNITYALADSDSVVTAALYYDTNNDMTGGVAITGCGAVTEAGTTCAFDTTGMETGSYYIYGVTSDGVNAPVSAVSAGTLTINPSGSVPTVFTGAATNVGSASAILHGMILSNGGVSLNDAGFASSTDPKLITGVSTTSLGAITTSEFSAAVTTLLSPNTTYYYRAYASNAIGTGYGSTRSFTTNNSSVIRKLRLFSSGRIRFLNGRILLHQR